MMLSLIGYRATGKTTLGQKLARRLDYSFKDSDVEIEKLAGKSISKIFSEDGEPRFRDLEEKVIEELCREERIVLATGGGAIMRQATRDRLRSAGTIIWLTASPETILSRIQGDARTAQTRPNLTAQGGLEEIIQILSAREPFYRQLAEMTVSTENASLDELVETIMKITADK